MSDENYITSHNKGDAKSKFLLLQHVLINYYIVVSNVWEQGEKVQFRVRRKVGYDYARSKCRIHYV